MSVPDAAVSFLLDNIVQILAYNYKLVKDVEGNIKDLQKELTALEGLMKDFAKYNHDSDYLKVLVKEIKSIIDDAEDVVDTYVLQAAVQKSQTWISKTFHVIDYPLKLRDVGKEIQKISETIKKVHLEKARNAYEILQYQAIGKLSKPVKPKEHLHIGTTDLEDWETSADHFPYLKCLELHGCDKLKDVPAGFSDISSLQSVDLHCTNKDVASSAKTLQEEKVKKSPNFKLSVYPPDHLKDNASSSDVAAC